MAAAAQSGRNAMQRDLTTRLGTVGATQVRFLYGLPFAALACLLILGSSEGPVPVPGARSLLWGLGGAVAQMLATVLLLAAMQGKSFVVAISLTKIEPVWVALLGLVLLGDRLELGLAASILVATAGVLALSWPERDTPWTPRPVLMGIASGALFAMSSICFRGAILAVPEAHFLSASSLMLVLSMTVQTLMLSAWLRLVHPGTLGAVIRAWRPCLLTGALAAMASLCWFIAFSLESAARVRTLALIELLFAHIIATGVFKQHLTLLERVGLTLLVIGVVALLAEAW
jgi:drug/metabolite transporter (DMT)-like permease